ncbi:MAG TPA: M56 family metallopeptidase, partial [Steroidobacteraceae bacterium]|nr:M56 family metallopeptidase [Steroidobacteraceae bacterium]
MLRFALYALALSALFSAAAWALERAQIAARQPRRWVWLVAMLASICAPAVNHFIPTRIVPVHISAPAAASAPTQIAQTEQPAVTATVRVQHTANWHIPELPSIDRVLRLAWIVASCALLLSYLCAMLALQRRAQSWTRRDIDGHSVLSSGDIGPAVIGVWTNRIVVPSWIFDASPQLRSAALLHEQQHIRGRDSLMLNGALLCAILMPWNPLLWWQLKCLRFAIETDCDCRVLAEGVAVADYGDALLTIGRQQHGLALGAISLIEPASQLERRIKNMTNAQPNRPKLIASAWALCCATVVAFAGQIDTPAASGLRLPPPGTDLQYTLNQIVHDAFPDLFKQHLAQPVSLKLILNNDLSIDYSEKKLWPVGTSMETALPSPSTPTAGFDVSLLDPNDPLSVHQIKQTSTDGEPVFIHIVVRGIHKSRTAQQIRAALKNAYSDVYAKAFASDEVLIAL